MLRRATSFCLTKLQSLLVWPSQGHMGGVCRPEDSKGRLRWPCGGLQSASCPPTSANQLDACVSWRCFATEDRTLYVCLQSLPCWCLPGSRSCTSLLSRWPISRGPQSGPGRPRSVFPTELHTVQMPHRQGRRTGHHAEQANWGSTVHM